MQLTVHDVGHGLCISLVHENGNVMVWDAGHTNENRPSEFLQTMGIRKIDYFFVTNYDQDHISDLPNLRANIRLRSLYRNVSISAEQLIRLKLQTGPITLAMASMIEMIESYTGGPLSPAPEFPRVSFRLFSNSFNSEFTDTNNISLVTFLSCGGTKFIIPGDLETSGWQSLMNKSGFVDELRDVNIFFASHHGRSNGYCEEIFEICSPDVIIFSDSNIVHATQEMSQIYASHANGISFDGQTRYVLTTRNDGTFTWTLN